MAMATTAIHIVYVMVVTMLRKGLDMLQIRYAQPIIRVTGNARNANCKEAVIYSFSECRSLCMVSTSAIHS